MVVVAQLDQFFDSKATILFFIPQLFNLIPKVIKYNSDLFKQEITLTVDENLTKLKGKVLAPTKLKAANVALKKLKHSLPG